MKKIFLLLSIALLFSNCGGEKRTQLLLSTEYGDMTIELYDETPQHRDNFVKLAKEGFYDGTLFHRVIRGFMIQGGDPDSKGAAPDARLGMGGPGYTVPAEFVSSLFHKKGALSAARRGAGNPNKESSGSQFYIVQGRTYQEAELDKMPNMTPERKAVYTDLGGTPSLDDAYTVFGEVVSGMEIIDKIAGVKTAPGDRPTEDVAMTLKVIE